MLKSVRCHGVFLGNLVLMQQSYIHSIVTKLYTRYCHNFGSTVSNLTSQNQKIMSLLKK